MLIKFTWTALGDAFCQGMWVGHVRKLRPSYKFHAVALIADIPSRSIGLFHTEEEAKLAVETIVESTIRGHVYD